MYKRIVAVMGLFVALVVSGCQAEGDRPLPPISVGMQPTARPQADSSPAALPAPPRSTPVREPPPFDLRQTDNLLLLGTDRRPTWTHWHTDSIMVIGIDHEYGRAAVLSIPRDLYVSVPGYGQTRINQVDYLGEKKVNGSGPLLLSQVISQTVGVATEHWVRVELNGFADLVDALGGVTVHLDCPFYELIYDLDEQMWTYFTLPAGDVLMDGETAYRFVTLRYIESDFGRSRRQRQFLWALRNQASRSNLVRRLPELWSAFHQTFSTDLSLLDMIQLVRFGLAIEPENVRSGALTGQELDRYITPKGADVLRVTDPAKIARVVDDIWTSASLSETGQRDPAACPPRPRGVPSYVAEQVLPQVATPPAAGEAVGGGGGEPIPVEPDGQSE